MYYYVYYLKSKIKPEETYIGFTSNLKQRLADHNAGRSVYTKNLRPWELVGFLGFDEELKALKFERHLKTNAGRIFLRRYFKGEVMRYLPKPKKKAQRKSVLKALKVDTKGFKFNRDEIYDE